jgi:hypothetical protein
MTDGKELDELFRCLLAGVRTPADDAKHRYEQSRQLLLAFDRIGDCELRQELIVLMEIVSKMPDALRKNRVHKLATPALNHVH